VAVSPDVEAALVAVEEPRDSTEPVQIPPELRLYPDRKRFLAIQIADAQSEGYVRPHDLASLAQLIQRGEVVTLPDLGEDYVLDDVGADAREDPLSHYDVAANRDVPLFPDMAAVQAAEEEPGASSGSHGDSATRRALVVSSYADPQKRAMLFAEHAAITSLARSFEGRSYDLGKAEDVARLQQRMLSSLRPAARDVLLSLAKEYHARFGRLLPIVSLIRTERYQRHLAHVNPNATHVTIAPHTTGEAFDITYRYMASDEQDFLMKQIAQLEDAGHVEAIRERRNCFHVFAFADGRRPAETLIASARDQVNTEASALEGRSEPRRHGRAALRAGSGLRPRATRRPASRRSAARAG